MDNNTPRVDKTTGQEHLTPKEKREERDEIDKAREQRAHKLAEGSTVSWKDSLEVNKDEEIESDEIQQTVRHHRKGEAA
jgi:hypothetical protein